MRGRRSTKRCHRFNCQSGGRPSKGQYHPVKPPETTQPSELAMNNKARPPRRSSPSPPPKEKRVGEEVSIFPFPTKRKVCQAEALPIASPASDIGLHQTKSNHLASHLPSAICHPPGLHPAPVQATPTCRAEAERRRVTPSHGKSRHRKCSRTMQAIPTGPNPGKSGLHSAPLCVLRTSAFVGAESICPTIHQSDHPWQPDPPEAVVYPSTRIS